MIDITIKLFGALRNLRNDSSLQISAPAGITVEELRKDLESTIRALQRPEINPQILAESAFADETHILEPHDRIETSCTIAVLPPVCGG